MDKGYEETEERVVEEGESFATFVDESTSKKKKRRRSMTEHAKKKKKPRSAFLLYYSDVYKSLQQENPDMPQSEINKCISDSWKRLSVADKAYYLDRAKGEKDGLKPISQFTTSHDIPGFRKILPRTDYELLPKTSPVEKTSDTLIEVCMEDEVGTLKQEIPEESVASPLIVGNEVELTEQCVTVEPKVVNVILDSGRRVLILPQQARPHTPRTEKKDGGGTQSGAHDVIEQGPEGGTTVSQIKLDTAQVVTIIPNSELVENKTIPVASPIMMLPITKHVKPLPEHPVKLSIKYCRRGRGSCSTPGCAFMYVTRHKPPVCPKCGQRLGGK